MYALQANKQAKGNPSNQTERLKSNRANLERRVRCGTEGIVGPGAVDVELLVEGEGLRRGGLQQCRVLHPLVVPRHVLPQVGHQHRALPQHIPASLPAGPTLCFTGGRRRCRLHCSTDSTRLPAAAVTSTGLDLKAIRQNYVDSL